MSGRRAGLAVGAVVVVALLGAVPLVRSLGTGGDLPVTVVTRGDFVHRVQAEGVLAAETATVLSTPVTAGNSMKIAWMAPDGSEVSAGETVIRFDATDMRKQLFDGEAERAKADSKTRKSEIEQQTTLGNLERDARLADMQLEHAREFQTEDAEIFSRADILESEIDETLAAERKEHAAETRQLRQQLGGLEVDLLELERRRAELTIERAEAGLAELEVEAPHDGIFVLRRDWGEPPQIGQMVWPGQALAEIPQLDAMKAIVYVLEADAGGVEPGVRADVTLEAHPDVTYAATVRRVAALAKRRTRYSPVQYFEVELALERTDHERMKPGQRVRATLRLHDQEGVLTVPREAVFDAEDGGRVVWRRAGGGFEAVPVRLGAAALGRVVVTAGLREGDRIALVDPTGSGRATETDESPTPTAAGAPEISR